MKKKYKYRIFIITFFTLLLLLRGIAKNYTITVTESLPLGVYKLSKINNIKVGDVVQFKPDKEIMDFIYNREYLPKYATTLLKEVAADYSNRDEIEIINDGEFSYLYVSGKNYGIILNTDSIGRKITPLRVEDLKPRNKDEYLLLSSHIRSYDSRYFGLVNRKDILKKAELKIKF
ncbi:S26 family signal peptidase [Fusobacterium watanabei]|uniref:S26 family signal peptidase n=1 Tax=Fusobacterium watanabei TaxID=2686067 RepID=UPI003B58975C